jgi:TRAP-type C4-dicarboxylate transport system permease small subunit
LALVRSHDQFLLASGRAMFAVVTVNVVLRYLFSSGLVWGGGGAI